MDRWTSRYAILGKKWRTAKRPWSLTEVLRHLAGEIAIALYWKFEVQTLMFDIDNHDPKGSGRHAEIARKIMKSLPVDAIVYQSSESAGLRIVAFVDRPIPRQAAQHWILGVLQRLGLENRPGVIEARMDGKPDRLPFGRASRLCDPTTLEPTWRMSLGETIDYVWEIRRSNSLDADKVLQAPLVLLGGTPKPQWRQLVPKLLSDGLSADITTNQALLMLNLHFQGDCGMTPAQAEENLSGWIRQKHNGLSVRINRGDMSNVIEQIRRVVLGFKANKWATAHKVSLDPVQPLPITGKDLRRLLDLFQYQIPFKELVAGVSILELCKGHLDRKSTERVTYAKRLSKHATPSNYHQRFSLCTNTSIPIPTRNLMTLRGFPKANPGAMISKLCSRGLLRRSRDSHGWTRHCREFRLLIQLDEEGPEVKNLELALVQTMSDAELRRRFGLYFARKIVETSKQLGAASVLGE